LIGVKTSIAAGRPATGGAAGGAVVGAGRAVGGRVVGACRPEELPGKTWLAPWLMELAACSETASGTGTCGAPEGVGDGPRPIVTALLYRHTPPFGLKTARPVSVSPSTFRSMRPRLGSLKRRYVSTNMWNVLAGHTALPPQVRAIASYPT
jgi:hypothetical protein